MSVVAGAGERGSAATGSAVRINAGGPAYTAADGRAFAADSSFSGGSTLSVTAAIAGTSDPALYQNERWGQFGYSIPVANGTYDVTFHFVELYYTTGSCVGKRIFSMDILDTPVTPDVANLDICAQAGGADRALVKTVTGVQVGDGTLDVQSVYGSVDDPEVAAIEVTPSAATGAPTVVSTTPTGGAAGIGTAIAPQAGFSRPMDGSTITSTSFTLTAQGSATPVAATVAYDSATNAATLRPSAPLSNSTQYTATLAASIKASDGTPLAAPYSWTFTTAAAGGSLSTVRINTGGPAYTAKDGRVFAADTGFTGGSTLQSGNAVSGTPDPALYQNERWGQFSYAVPVANGTYDVTLHFVELYYPNPCSGKRVFGIDILDTAVSPDVPNIDICAAAGANAAFVKTVQGVQVSDGTLNLTSVYGAADDPEIAAIEVVPAGPAPSQVGQWSSVQNWPVAAVDATVMPTGNVLVWDLWGSSPGSERYWNPANGAFTPVPYTVGNRFCGGHVTLADGRTLVIGGWDGVTAEVGIKSASIFDPTTRTWTKQADMNAVRWYPTATMLPDGRVLATAGDSPSFDGSRQTALVDGSNTTPEVYDPAANTWTSLPQAKLLMPFYPFMFVLPDGRLFEAGPDTTTRVLDPATWTWSTVGTSPVSGQSAVMYRPGKVMTSGTWSSPDFASLPVTGRTAVIDMTQPSPAWRETAPMAFPRAYHDLTVLPDGTVLATGGESHSEGADAAYAVHPAELWNPDTATWTTMASEQIERLYHSVAVLLPDGRVLVAGGGGNGNEITEANAEIYSPPYLFKGARPTIAAAPATAIPYGSSFTVTTPDAASIASVSLVRPGSVTHQFDQEQRFTRLSFTAGSGSLTVQAPANANLAPPGYYMLFVVNSSGVPSVASFVRFPAGPQDTQPPTAPTNLTAAGSLGKATLSWSAASDDVGVALYDVYRGTASGFVPSSSNRIAQTAATSYTDAAAARTYWYVVKAEDAAGNLGPASNQASATITADTTAPTVSITAPAAGAALSGATSVTADASDDVAVSGVQFKLDGANLGAEDTTSPYSVSWNTATAANGSHTLTAVARDAAGNAATSAPVTVTVSNAAPTGGLVAAYGFNEGTGTTARDASGNANNGTVTATTWSTAGHAGGALSFNGTSAYVSVPDSASLGLSTGMTLEAWVNPTANATTWRTVVMREQPPSNLTYALYANTDTKNPSAHVFTSAEAILKGGTATSVPLNAWTHLAATYDGATLRLYVNGTQIASKAVTGAIVATTGAVRIGGNKIWGEWFKGLIDDVRIYNRALAPSEIQADMATPVSP